MQQNTAGGCSQLRFSHLAAGSREEAFWEWREIASTLFDVAVSSRDAIKSFHFEMTSHNLGSMLIGNVAAAGQHFRRSSATIARGGLDHYLVQLYRSGGYRGEVETREVCIRAGDIGILDLSQRVHSVADNFSNISLILPRAALAPLVKRPEAMHGLVISGETVRGRILSEHIRALAREVESLTRMEGQALVQPTAALVAACVDPAEDARDDMVQAVHAASIIGIKQHIEESLGSPDLTLGSLQRKFGVSRSTLYRLFEFHGGVFEYIRDRRLSRCFAEITSPKYEHRRIGDIAYSWGFSNEASFSRAFRRAFDMSPREARSTARSAKGPARQSSNPSDSIKHWLRTLEYC